MKSQQDLIPYVNFISVPLKAFRNYFHAEHASTQNTRPRRARVHTLKRIIAANHVLNCSKYCIVPLKNSNFRLIKVKLKFVYGRALLVKCKWRAHAYKKTQAKLTLKFHSKGFSYFLRLTWTKTKSRHRVGESSPQAPRARYWFRV